LAIKKQSKTLVYNAGENDMKKKISILVLIVLMFSMSTLLVACNSEAKYAKKLTKLGYSIEQKGGKFYDSDLKGGYREFSAGKNDDTWVLVEIYDNIDDAKKKYSDYMSDIDDERSVYRDGKVVIYGTKNAVNDARSK
jgi:hypothetical protein